MASIQTLNRLQSLPITASNIDQFIAWDGEGANSGDRTAPQDYVLFGCSTGERITGKRLHTIQCLELILQVAEKNPGAIHIGFAFDYDVNMILQELPVNALESIRDTNATTYMNYRIEHIPHKWFQVTRYGAEYPENPYDKVNVKIADIFGFFQQSFVKALKSYIPDHPLMAELPKIEAGKKDRDSFDYENIQYITAYWETEIQLLRLLANKLREYMYSVGLFIEHWHGPGALANYVYRMQGIADHKSDCPSEVRDAARYGYAGGRFEMFRLGRFKGPVYGIDINSAYPAAIANLPSLSEGYWRKVEAPSEIVEFGIYHVKLNVTSMPVTQPGPLFHRDSRHNISFPWSAEGWYWSPEIKVAKQAAGNSLEIIEGWEYVGWESRPFGFVKDMYEQRKEMKAKKQGSQLALKLALNSLYGKMAQRVGWEHTGSAPKWHQLEWAGYVTSMTRAKLYAVMCRIPYDQLIAVETDGIYTTMTPAELGITDSKELGQWEATEYRQAMYIQSGVYFMENMDGTWTSKYRGMDNGSLSPEKFTAYLRELTPDGEWPTLTGPTTRFIGYRNAINRAASDNLVKEIHCVWETKPHEITPGRSGKRTHSAKLCNTCADGYTGYDRPHELVIQSNSFREPFTSRHSIPWEVNDNGTDAQWRMAQRKEEGVLA